MTRRTWATMFVAVLTGAVIVASAAAAPLWPTKIDLPFITTFNAAGTAIPDPTIPGEYSPGYSPEGIAIRGTNFYSGSTQTGEIIKGDLVTGALQRGFVPQSPATTSPDSANHRGLLGLLVDSHNRLWGAGSMGVNAPTATPPTTSKGMLFVWDATTGAPLAQYTLTTAASKAINDLTISGNAVYVANTTAPNGAGTEVQFRLQLGPDGALPPSDAPGSFAVNPAVTQIPTPGFAGADGIDTLPNGNIIFTSVTTGNMIVVNATTLAVTPITVTAAATCLVGTCAPPLLSGDGVSLDATGGPDHVILYYPENRANTATPPGDVAAVRLIPPDYTTAEIVGRLSSPPGLPPLRSPANTEQYGHFVYVISRELLPNPVTGLLSVTHTFVERLDKIPVACTSTGSTGPMTIHAGEAVCLNGGAQQTGPVTVEPGGTLNLDGVTVTGPITASDPGSVRVCGSTVTGPITVTGSTGLVLIGGDAATGTCAANNVTGPVSLTGNTAGVEFNGNTVIGPLTITDDTGVLPAPDTGAVHAAGNTVIGPVQVQT